MKLLTRTNIYFIAITLIVFSLGGKVFYERVRSLNKEDAKERLEEEKQKVLGYVQAHHTLPQNAVGLGESISYSPASGNEKDKNGHVKIYNLSENEYEPYQTLEFTINNNGSFYRATIYRSLMEADDLETAITESVVIIGSCLLLILLLSNYFMTKMLWLPFYRTLKKIRTFDITKDNGIAFEATRVTEFKALNDGIEAMTKKISADYHTLKEFTENASHELQTPLSVIQSKLELLIQSDNLNSEQLGNVQVVYESTNRLSKLNQALLLLTKIENRQFAEIKEVAIHKLIQHKLELLKEWTEHRKLNVETRLEPLTIKASPVLADVLVTNLLTNAIKHNQEEGKLYVEVKDKHFLVINSGDAAKENTSELFSRFKKANQASDSLGLGLAIVKEICNVYGYSVSYNYKNWLHYVTIGF